MPDVLNEKEQQLLRILFESTSPITAPALAKKLGVSERTARARVQSINKATGKPCIDAGRHGYTCNREIA